MQAENPQQRGQRLHRRPQGPERERKRNIWNASPKIPVCSGKTAYIRKSYHERIQRIVQVIGKNGLTLSVYVDRVLEEHFREYEEVIRKLYKKSYEDIY
jgi:hypothetical protein